MLRTIYKPQLQDGVQSQNIHHKQLNSKMIITRLRNGQMSRTDISPKKTSKWPTGTWEVLNISNHQGNVKWNLNELLPHTCQNVNYQNKTKKKPHKEKTSAGKDERKSNPHARSVRMHTCTVTVGHNMKVPQENTTGPILRSSHSISEYTPKGNKLLSWRAICTEMPTTALFTTAKVWRQPKCPPMHEQMKHGVQHSIVSTVCISRERFTELDIQNIIQIRILNRLFSSHEGGDATVCDSTEEPGVQDTRKPGRERYMGNVSLLCRIKRSDQSQSNRAG